MTFKMTISQNKLHGGAIRISEKSGYFSSEITLFAFVSSEFKCTLPVIIAFCDP